MPDTGGVKRRYFQGDAVFANPMFRELRGLVSLLPCRWRNLFVSVVKLPTPIEGFWRDGPESKPHLRRGIVPPLRRNRLPCRSHFDTQSQDDTPKTIIWDDIKGFF